MQNEQTDIFFHDGNFQRFILSKIKTPFLLAMIISGSPSLLISCTTTTNPTPELSSIKCGSHSGDLPGLYSNQYKTDGQARTGSRPNGQ
jgi:hypothetical protein